MNAANVQAAPALKWHEVWSQVYFHPSVDSFLRILSDPQARPGRAYLWVAVVSIFAGLLQGFSYNTTGQSGLGVSGPALALGCGFIFAPIMAIIGLALGSALVHWIAGLFGGQGTFDRMVYAFGAIEAPASLISAVFTTLLTFSRGDQVGGLSALGLCAVPFSLAWGIYLLILQFNAIKAVERLTTGKAILTMLFPVIALLVLVGACFLFTFPLAVRGGS